MKGRRIYYAWVVLLLYFSVSLDLATSNVRTVQAVTSRNDEKRAAIADGRCIFDPIDDKCTFALHPQ